MIGRVHQLSVSPGGVPKLAVLSAVVGTHGLEGDGHADAKNHGGPERAVCLWALEVIERLRSERHGLAPGAAGENVTIAGLDWADVVPGARLRLGADVLLEVTRYTTPCWKNAQWFIDGDFNRMHHATHPGESRVYARVVTGGRVTTGDSVELLNESAAVRVARTQPASIRWRPPSS